MKLKEETNAGDKTNTSAAVVVQKQVKQKLLQAQQEEALFVKTSSALQSKMEKVDQQISQSMNGYHLGLHLKQDAKSASANHNAPNNPKCPMESTNHNHSNGNHQPAPEPEVAKKTNNNNNDEDIASSYFQSKYGSDQEQHQPPISSSSHRSQSVGFNGNNRSTTQTPERDIQRASSQAPTSKNSSKNNSRRPSFSYLSLLSKDGSMPHRTQPIGSAQTSRRNSTVGKKHAFKKNGNSSRFFKNTSCF